MSRLRKKLPVETAEVIIQRNDGLQHLKEVTLSANKAIGMAKYQQASLKQPKKITQIHNEYTGHADPVDNTYSEYNLEDIDLNDLFTSEEAA